MSSLACPSPIVIEEFEPGIPFDRAFAAVCDRPGSFFLDSAQFAGGLGAYSFIGFDPFLEFSSKGSRISISCDGQKNEFFGDPLAEMRRLFARFRGGQAPGLPFAGGAVGYFAYEFFSQIEPVVRARTGRSKEAVPDEEAVPDVRFGFYDGVVAFDQSSGRMLLVANPVYRTGGGAIVRRLEREVLEGIARQRSKKLEAAGFRASAGGAPRPLMPKATYLSAVARIKEYIASGDVYQVNLTQRFDATPSRAPLSLYERLRHLSPAPFSCYLDLGSLQIVGSSPERFLRIANGRVETRPIKGTRPRGRNPIEDERLRNELFRSEKDRAELLMIVDLERNDLGRVCGFGTVRVDEPCRLESHPTVHHLVASVSGRLRPKCDAFDCIRAMFPGGSITGAPKIRAMQIIDEVESCPRGVYTGSIGYIGFDGAADLNIAIRTIICSGGRATYHVGGGIVWDSDPEAEFQECMDKGRAMFATLSDSEPC
jgi:para-aminobenzoate synthetase component 1